MILRIFKLNKMQLNGGLHARTNKQERDGMIHQVSDFELELMKTIWENAGTALYAEIVEALEKKEMSTTKRLFRKFSFFSEIYNRNTHKYWF